MENAYPALIFNELTAECPEIVSGRKRAREICTEIESILSDRLTQWVSLDTSVVVFGSLARGEWTEKSDVDWTYVIDGQANSDHLIIAQQIKEVLEERFKKPNPQGPFASMAFSHDLIHQIGGQDDTNRNMTQRILLLLESLAIGAKAQEAYERVIKGIISRYLEEDARLLAKDGTCYKVPRFLLNDIARFWRTMAVDFASKQRDRGGKGWGLRNLKLRMSRKLLFASGLLTCFACEIDENEAPLESKNSDELRAYLIDYLRSQFRMRPLEIVAYAVQRYGIPKSVGIRLFESYDHFLGLLNDGSVRERLENLRAENAAADTVFRTVQDVSHEFQASLNSIFFENEQIGRLTKKYGVF